MDPISEPCQDDAIIRVAAYHRRDFAHAVVHSVPSEHDPVRNSVAEPFPSAAVSDLGALDRLPLELISSICLCLDVRSCFKFRQINRRARQIVSGLYKYRAVAEHGLESLRAVLRTDISRYFTVPDLYRPLCTPSCARCRSPFGGFLWIPTASRYCFACIEWSHLRVVPLEALVKYSGVSSERLQRLRPVLRTLPGTYTTKYYSWTSRTEVVAAEPAFDALRASGLPLQHAMAVLAAIPDTFAYTYMVSTALPLLDPATGQVQHGLSCKGCYIAFAARDNGTKGRNEPHDRVYSRQGYLDHFPLCHESIKLWEASKAGTVAVSEPEFTRRGGYLADHDKLMRSYGSTGGTALTYCLRFAPTPPPPL